MVLAFHNQVSCVKSRLPLSSTHTHIHTLKHPTQSLNAHGQSSHDRIDPASKLATVHHPVLVLVLVLHDTFSPYIVSMYYSLGESWTAAVITRSKGLTLAGWIGSIHFFIHNSHNLFRADAPF